MGVTLRAEKGIRLTKPEGDANFQTLHGLPIAKTIASGVIAVEGTGFYSVDTEGAASTDDLTQITGVTGKEVIILKAAATGRTVVVKHNPPNIRLQNGADFSMDSEFDTIVLRSNGTNQLYEASGGRCSVPA